MRAAKALVAADLARVVITLVAADYATLNVLVVIKRIAANFEILRDALAVITLVAAD